MCMRVPCSDTNIRYIIRFSEFSLYFSTSNELATLSGTLGRHLAELLRHFNSRCCQLVLGAGAMQVAGLKTITSTILVLASRSLQLLLWFMPFVKTHFQGLFTNGYFINR